MSLPNDIKIQPRSKAGKGVSRALRRQQRIPAIIYGGNEENLMITVDPRDIIKGLDYAGFYTKVFNLVGEKKTHRAICKTVQFHVVTDQPIHVDFMRVHKDTKLHLNIPIHFVNETASPGLKQGGILNIVHHSLPVVCRADDIPESITIDLTGLEVGASIQLNKVTLPKGVVPANAERDNTLATIVAASSKG